ncbi:MAG: EAL domain-containing protein [Gammaproteobacteria bacterium]
MINARFTSRVLFVTVLPVVSTAIILAIILITGRINEFNKRIDERGENIANYLAPISEYGIFANNFSYLDSTLDNTLRQPDLILIYITDPDNNIILKRTHDAWSQLNIDNIDPELFRVFHSDIFTTSIDIDDLDQISVPNFKSASKIGTVYVVMSLAKSKIAKSRIIKDGIFITLISTIATILIALLFSRSVIRPITNIHKSVDTIRKGDLNHRISINFTGELAELARDINNMASSLEIAQIKDKQRAEDALFLEKTKAQITLEAIGEGVITTDIHGNITYMNPTAEKLTGFTLQHAMNRPLSDIFKIKEEDCEELFVYPIMECIQKSKKIHHDSGYILYRGDGTEFTIRETATPLLDKDDNVVGAVLVFHDFTSIKKMSDVLAYQATHDDLTGLLNRRAFESRMHDILKAMQPDDSHVLCYIDLDQFKVINDTCGHLAGDSLLKIISNKINENIRKNDLFARLGGDEFGIIFLDCNLDRARTLAENIRTMISNIKFTWDTHTFKVASSIGIVPVIYNESMTDLMMTVDTACYVAKDKGRNRIHVYQKNDEDVLQRKGELQWFQKIHNAIDNDNFVLYSQKMASFTSTGELNFHEILIRLNDNGELILPGVFIPAAERYSLMPKIDRWVIRTLFRLIKEQKISDSIYFSINLSGQTLTDDTFVSFLNHELDNTRFPADHIIFEITETATISNFQDANNFIRELKLRGCKFSLDDFGSGMSSFQYLSELDIDYLKIDGNFVKDISENPFNQSIVNSISQIGHSINLEIVAEYVENEKILSNLDKDLIDYVQGYGIERPRPLKELFS